MCLVLEKLYITKLKIILQSKYLYLLLFFFVSVWVFLGNIRKHESIYDLNDNEFIMRITNIKSKDNKVTLYLDGKEKLVATYYLKEGEENCFEYGELIRIKGTLKVPFNNTIPHTFNYKKYLERRNIHYILKIDSYELREKSSGLYKIKNSIVKRINSIDKTGYMKAFIIGDKSIIDEDDYDNYQGIGITHLFAISGMHIGVLSEIMVIALKKVKNGLKYLIIDVLLIAYGFIVCFPASILRCIIFYVLNSINKIFNLDVDGKRILLLTIFVIMFINHKVIYDIGYWYSVCTVGGIIFCNSFINDNNILFSSFKLSLIAFLFSLPISLFSFYECNMLSMFYNMFFIPFVSLVVYPLSLISFLLPFIYPLFNYSIKVMEWIGSILRSFNYFNIYMSFNLIEVLLFYFGLLIVFVKQQKQLLCLLIVIVLLDIIIPYFDKSSYIYYLDVDQGDSTLIVGANKKSITLIDTGGIQDEKISKRYMPLFKYLGIKKIDYLVLTHGDYDHMGEATNLIDNFNVKKVVFNYDEYDELEKELIKVLKHKRINYYHGINKLDKLVFLNSRVFDNENDNSNVIYMRIGKYRFLFMGDSGVDREQEIINKYNLGNIDFLKVGHHGSRTSSSKTFINKINPKYSIISVGRYNRYGHPNKEVLKNLRYSKVYRTDQDGSVTVIIKGNKLKIETSLAS